jgi:PAS domain S-box-containing protein
MVSKINNYKKLKYNIKKNQLSRSEFEQLAEASNDSIRIINKDFTIRYINQSFAEMTGVNQNDVIGKKCWEVFPGSLCHTIECRLQRILDGEQNIQVEIERMKKNGTIIPCRASTLPLRDEAGKLTGIVEQFRDITEHRLMKKQVEESEERYKALVELGAEAGEAIVVLQDTEGQEGNQVFFNDQWPKITGYDKEELLGRSFFVLVSPDDIDASLDRHRRKMSGESVSGLFEINLIRKNGVTIPIELSGAHAFYQGKKVNVLYIRDITQRKLMEKNLQDEKERYQSIFDNIPVAIWEMDYSESKRFLDELAAKGITDFDKYFEEHPEAIIEFENRQKMISSNKAGQAIFEAEKQEDFNVIGVDRAVQSKKIYKQGRKLLPFKHKKMALLSIIGGQRQQVHEEVILTAKGNKKNIQFWRSAAPGHEKDLSRVFITVVDITDRVEAEKKLRDYQNHLESIIKKRTKQLEESRSNEHILFKNENKLRKELENKIKQQTEFIRRLVHDFKTPLLPMIGTSEMMLRVAKDDNIKQMALNINRGAMALNDSVNDLIDVMRGEIGILQLEYQETDITKVLKEAMEFFRFEAERKEQILSLELMPELPVIWADINRLRQVIMNILENALRYTPAGGQINVRAKKSKTSIIIEVVDKGPGINKSDLPLIFKPYYSTEIRYRHPGGLGLGLPLAKILVELHHGKIWVKNQPDQGARIGFSIPIQ